jgi:hypothetical protein
VQLLFDLLSSCSGLLKHNAATTPAAVTVPTLRLRPRAAIERVPAWTPHDHLERRGGLLSGLLTGTALVTRPLAAGSSRLIDSRSSRQQSPTPADGVTKMGSRDDRSCG